MNWTEVVRNAFKGLMVHKVRSVLSMLGIIFGIGSVVCVLSVFEGARGEIKKQIEALGATNVIVRKVDLGQDRKTVRDFSAGINLDEFTRLKSALFGLRSAAPLQIAKTSVRAMDNTYQLEVVGTTDDFPDVSGFRMLEGRFFSPLENREMQRVAVIEENIAREIFKTASVTGREIGIHHEKYLLIGVLASKQMTGKSMADVAGIEALNQRIYIPLNTAFLRLPRRIVEGELDEMIFRAADIDMVRPLRNVIERTLLRAHNIEHLESKFRDFSVIVAQDLLRQTEKTQTIFNIVMGCSAGISLLVGGIGIMNIMLASVNERRREVGIRRAVGARRSDILKQFIMEATAICFLGGVIGVGFGVGLTVMVSTFAGWETEIAVYGILISLFVAILDGIVFGTYPAIAAAKLDPIEALQYE